jgi:hypothetical protein
MQGAGRCPGPIAERARTVATMIRHAVVVVVLGGSGLALAQPGLAPPTTPRPDAAAPAAHRGSPLEPGSLEAGQLALRLGVGLGNGAFGLGAEGALGLGGVDLLASIGYLPQFCLNLGELGGGCDPALVVPGLGVQVKLGEAGPVQLGGRVKGEASVSGDRTGLVVAGVGGSTGSAKVRVSFGAVATGWYEEDDPFMENGFYVGPEIGLAVFKNRAGGAVTFGYGFPLQGQPEWMPIMSLSLVVR